jgi:divalent metal cation (Fe/Co/Zn/Cd) transporter
MGNFSVVALYIDLDRNLSFEESSKIADRVQEKIKKEKSEIWFAIVHTCPV